MQSDKIIRIRIFGEGHHILALFVGEIEQSFRFAVHLRNHQIAQQR